MIVVDHFFTLNIFSFEMQIIKTGNLYSGRLFKAGKLAASNIQGTDLPSVIYILWVLAYTIDKR
jgi:hypothetical protein